jgi:hypothetical protein
MHKRLRGVWWGLLAGSMVGSAQAVSLQVPEPGYLSIDGVYYGYGLRDPEPVPPLNAVLSLLGGDGFHLRSVFALGNCRRQDGSAATAVGAGQPRLRFGDAAPVEGEAGLALATSLPSGSASVGMAVCKAATVLFLRSADGYVACAERIAFPFQRGECPQLDASDPGFVFFGGFD